MVVPFKGRKQKKREPRVYRAPSPGTAPRGGARGPAGASDRHQLAHAVGFHVGAAATADDLATLHHQVLVGQFSGEVVELLDQHHGHLLAVEPLVGQLADGPPDVLDDAGLDALGGLVQDQDLGAGGQGARDGELLLLAAREAAKNLAALGHVAHAQAHALIRLLAVDRVAVELDVAVLDRHQAHEALEQRGLAHAIATEHDGDLADPGLEAQASQDVRAAGVLIDAFNLQHVVLSSSAAQVDLDDLVVGLHIGQRALGQHRALVQHGDLLLAGGGALRGQLVDELHVVLDHHQRVRAFERQKKLGGALGFFVGHAGHGLVEQQQLGVLHQQHADLEPLLLAVRKQAGRALGLVLEVDELQHGANAVELLATELEEHRGARTAVGLERELQVLEHAQVLEDGRLLKLAADADLGDLVLALFQQVDGRAEEGRATVRPGLAGDDVHHRGLARAIGADDAAHLAHGDVQAQLVERLETIEADLDVVEVEDRAVGQVDLVRIVHHAAIVGLATARLARVGGRVQGSQQGLAAFFHQVGGHAFTSAFLLSSFFTPPTMPSGRNRVTSTKSKPRKYSQNSGKATVNQLLAPLTKKAPMIGPISVARPPTAVQMAISMEAAADISLGLMMPTCGTYRAPAMAHITAESVQMASL